mmetsp:Transcript_9947/g.12400  ORF Transcript_9947/g.12400 Transcript_9947/m.12400 type:complete len:147 (+) Transcript_9947:175-615(+)
MQLDEGSDVRTAMGSICSVFLLTITCLYAYIKFDVLINRKDVDVLTANRDMFYSDDFIFGYEQGFNVAAAFTAYDSETEWILDKKYGEIFFNGFAWGPRPDGTYFTERRRLDDHICTLEELGYEGEKKNHRFFPVHEASAGIIGFY